MKTRQLAIYAKKIAVHGTGVKAMKWQNYRSAAVRYRELVRDLDFQGKNILEVGCGTGNLLPFIIDKTGDFRFRGVDILPEFIDECRSRYPDFDFEEDDYFAKPYSGYDIILCCGALNSAGRTMDERQECIRKMFNEAGQAVAFNMAGGHPLPKSSDQSIGYADSLQILEFCLSLTSKVILRQAYHKKDFTVILFK
jgi:cyclopropane fatty-acyl-phospholipid synthase-like methyltransferase